jgi:hypothetical protein
MPQVAAALTEVHSIDGMEMERNDRHLNKPPENQVASRVGGPSQQVALCSAMQIFFAALYLGSVYL